MSKKGISQKSHIHFQQSDFYYFVSIGDPLGIGWDIAKKLISKKKNYFNQKQISEFKQFVFIGDLHPQDKKILKNKFILYQYKSDDDLLSFLKSKKFVHRKNSKPLYVYLEKVKNYKNKKFNNSYIFSAYRSFQYFQRALDLVYKYKNASLITLPVSKENIIRSGVKFVGHTEVLQAKYKIKVFMCMYHPKISVFLLTNHLPLKKVAEKIKNVNYPKLLEALSFFKKLFGLGDVTKKKMSMLALNPHAGENGKIGDEEFFLKKQVKFFQKKNLPIEGPFSADGFFLKSNRKKYKLVVSCYHDQGLIPFKALYGAEGINITFNIPILRVSPDHGPAFDLDKNLADVTSVKNSFLFAIKYGRKWISLSQ